MPAPIIKQQTIPAGLGGARPATQTVFAYNGIDFGDQVKLLEYDAEAVYDWTGIDHLYNHLVIGVRAVVNPFALATADGVGATIIAGFRGVSNLAGETLANLETFLMVNQKQLIFQVGTEQVVVSPQDPTFPCDANNGPHPLAFRILEIKGTKTAVIYFRIETWVAAQRFNAQGAVVPVASLPLVLSNRWNVESQVDEDWKTTIITRGRMKLRADLLHAKFGPPPFAFPATPDLFRGAVMPLPIPVGFKRDEPTVHAREDGTELVWSCVDHQKVMNLGATNRHGPITRIKGQVTSGSEIEVKDAKDAIRKAVGVLVDFDPTKPFASIVAALQSIVPSVRNHFAFRAYGPPGADRSLMFNALLNLAADRFSPQGGGLPFNFAANLGSLILVALYATMSVDTDDLWVELRGELFGIPRNFFGVTLQPGNIGDFLNLANEVKAILPGSVPFGDTPTPPAGAAIGPFTNPNPPGDNSSRGGHVGALLVQVLKGDFVLPADNASSAQGPFDGDNSRPFQ